ncbi:MAG: FecR domain-containing protein, partial [Deltaproteobacteria bacterium]|nr:FecR domain-containing protein [Deltaproteobacteria bacterium]
MRFRRVAAVAAFSALASSTAALANGVGTVAIIEGNAYAQKGAIYFTRPNSGDEIKVNQFGQFRDTQPVPAYVKWEQNTRRHLQPNDSLEEGDIVQTMGDGWLKLIFKDDSMMDVGPASMLQIQKLEGQGPDRNVLFKLLYGKVRGVVAQKLSGPSHYQMLTPTALMGVRGTEFLVNVFPDREKRTQTEVVCLHGQVSVDITKFNEKGLVYTQPMVVNPGSVFATAGVHGLGQSTMMKALPQEKLRNVVARVTPGVNTRGTIVGASPPPTRLPGTGQKINYYAAAPKPHKLQTDGTVNTFDMDHPPANRMIASASGNFEVPHNFGDDPGAFGKIRDIR